MISHPATDLAIKTVNDDMDELKVVLEETAEMCNIARPFLREEDKIRTKEAIGKILEMLMERIESLDKQCEFISSMSKNEKDDIELIFLDVKRPIMYRIQQANEIIDSIK